MRRRFIVIAGAVLCTALCSTPPAGASTGWRVQNVPAPAGSSGAQLLAVSCPANGVCFAVGDSAGTQAAGQSTLAERWSGGHWVIQPTPSPGIGDVAQLTGISCLSVTDCTAVGIISTATAANSTLVEHWDGTSWTVVPSPDPAGTTTTDFTGVSCASDTSCVAVGLYDTSGNRPHGLPLAEHWDGTSWTITHVPLPAGITVGDLEGGVTCPSVTDCVAVGGIQTPSQVNELLAERWNGTRWRVQATPAPAGAASPSLSSVSCTSPARCTAVGLYFPNGGTATPLAERWDGTAWTIQNGLPANDGLASVSCTSSTSCTAVGITGAGAVSPVADHWDGTTWTQQPMPVPHNSTRNVFVSGVSCRSATTCTAVGVYGRTAKLLADHE